MIASLQLRDGQVLSAWGDGSGVVVSVLRLDMERSVWSECRAREELSAHVSVVCASIVEDCASALRDPTLVLRDADVLRPQ